MKLLDNEALECIYEDPKILSNSNPPVQHFLPSNSTHPNENIYSDPMDWLSPFGLEYHNSNRSHSKYNASHENQFSSNKSKQNYKLDLWF